MHSIKTVAITLAAATNVLAGIRCGGSLACGISLFPADCDDAANSIDETASYPDGTRIRHRTCLIEYTCGSGNPIAGLDLKGYYESVRSTCASDDICGDIDTNTCTNGGIVSVDYTTKNGRRTEDPSEMLTERAVSHNTCDGSAACGGVDGFTSLSHDCSAAIDAINTGINYDFGSDLSVGHCLMQFDCDPSLGPCSVGKAGGDVVQGACGRAFNECGNHCGQRTITGTANEYCKVDYRG